MGNDSSQVSPGSNAGDFQPMTSNPQEVGASNVQPSTPAVQPVQASDSPSAQQLYQQAEQQPNLTVQTDSFSANSLVSVQSTAPRSNSGLWSVTGALVILLLVVMIARRYWSVLPAIPLEDESAAEPELPAEAALPETDTTAASTHKTTAKKTPKAPAKKKPTKKKRAVKKN